MSRETWVYLGEERGAEGRYVLSARGSTLAPFLPAKGVYLVACKYRMHNLGCVVKISKESLG